MKRPRLTIAAGALLLALAVLPATGAKASETAQLPAFTVTLNGQAVDSSARQYPFLVYRNITYLPLTWFDCRALGVHTDYSSEGGLALTKTSVTAAPALYPGAPNPAQVEVAAVQWPVTINGSPYQNERWPLLAFRGVTYLPLTWQVAHDVLGWDYAYTDADGLKITSSNPVVTNLNLPADTVTAAEENGHLYSVRPGQSSEGGDGLNFDLLVQKNGGEETLNTSTGSIPRFTDNDGALTLAQHIGGAVMGHEIYLQLKDGAIQDTVSLSSFSYYLNSAAGRIYYNFWTGQGTLSADAEGQASLLPEGSGINVGADGQNSFHGHHPLSLQGDWLYFYGTAKDETAGRLFRVGIRDKALEQLGDTYMDSDARAAGANIWFRDRAGELHRARLADAADKGVRPFKEDHALGIHPTVWDVDDAGNLLWQGTAANGQSGWFLRPADGDNDAFIAGAVPGLTAGIQRSGKAMIAPTAEGWTVVAGGETRLFIDALTAKSTLTANRDGLLIYNDGRGRWHRLQLPESWIK